jgi:anaerobic ribonucleoside-triphosphate reductase
MNIKKQHIVLNLIKSGRYELNPETGEVISNIGKEKRVMKPIKHYSGYLQYCLDIGYGEQIMVYGQGFSYLATWLEPYNPTYIIDHKDQNKANNVPSNLRCITQKENLKDNGRPFGKNRSDARHRLPASIKAEIIEGHKLGISQVRLAEKYNTTRQTVAKIINVK